MKIKLSVLKSSGSHVLVAMQSSESAISVSTEGFAGNYWFKQLFLKFVSIVNFI